MSKSGEEAYKKVYIKKRERKRCRTPKAALGKRKQAEQAQDPSEWIN